MTTGNWRGWFASLVADVIGEDGEERLLLELLTAKAELYKEVEGLVLRWRRGMKSLHYLWDRNLAVERARAGRVVDDDVLELASMERERAPYVTFLAALPKDVRKEVRRRAHAGHGYRHGAYDPGTLR